MKYLLTIVVMLIIMIAEYKKHKNVLCATVVYPIFWVLSLLGLISADDYYPVSGTTLIVIIIGYLLFTISFNAVYRTRTISNRELAWQPKGSDDFDVSSFGADIVFTVALAIGVVYLLLIWRYVSLSSIKQTIISISSAKARNEVAIPLLLRYVSITVKISMTVFFALYMHEGKTRSDKKRKSINKKRFLILLILYTFILITNFSRNALLSMVLPLYFIMALEKKHSNKTIVITGLCSLIVFMIVFVWFSTIKVAYLFQGTDFKETAIANVRLYLSGSIVGFDQLLECGHIKMLSFDGGGRYTFSLVCAIIDALFGTTLTPEVVQRGISIGSTSTNVYTVYQWAAQDFGVLYSMFLQIPLGLIYGSLYRRLRNGQFVSTYWYCTLSYSLVMMFFQDQYFSISQSWFLHFIFAWIVFSLFGKTRVKIK